MSSTNYMAPRKMSQNASRQKLGQPSYFSEGQFSRKMSSTQMGIGIIHPQQQVNAQNSSKPIGYHAQRLHQSYGRSESATSSSFPANHPNLVQYPQIISKSSSKKLSQHNIRNISNENDMVDNMYGENADTRGGISKTPAPVDLDETLNIQINKQNVAMPRSSLAADRQANGYQDVNRRRAQMAKSPSDFSAFSVNSSVTPQRKRRDGSAEQVPEQQIGQIMAISGQNSQNFEFGPSPTRNRNTSGLFSQQAAFSGAGRSSIPASAQKTLRPYSTQNRRSMKPNRYSAYKGSSDLTYFDLNKPGESYKKLLKTQNSVVRPNSHYMIAQREKREIHRQSIQDGVNETRMMLQSQQMTRNDLEKAKLLALNQSDLMLQQQNYQNQPQIQNEFEQQNSASQLNDSPFHLTAQGDPWQPSISEYLLHNLQAQFAREESLKQQEQEYTQKLERIGKLLVSKKKEQMDRAMNRRVDTRQHLQTAELSRAGEQKVDQKKKVKANSKLSRIQKLQKAQQGLEQQYNDMSRQTFLGPNIQHFSHHSKTNSSQFAIAAEGGSQQRSQQRENTNSQNRNTPDGDNQTHISRERTLEQFSNLNKYNKSNSRERKQRQLKDAEEKKMVRVKKNRATKKRLSTDNRVVFSNVDSMPDSSAVMALSGSKDSSQDRGQSSDNQQNRQMAYHGQRRIYKDEPDVGRHIEVYSDNSETPQPIEQPSAHPKQVHGSQTALGTGLPTQVVVSPSSYAAAPIQEEDGGMQKALDQVMYQGNANQRDINRQNQSHQNADILSSQEEQNKEASQTYLREPRRQNGTRKARKTQSGSPSPHKGAPSPADGGYGSPAIKRVVSDSYFNNQRRSGNSSAPKDSPNFGAQRNKSQHRENESSGKTLKVTFSSQRNQSAKDRHGKQQNPKSILQQKEKQKHLKKLKDQSSNQQQQNQGDINESPTNLLRKQSDNRPQFEDLDHLSSRQYYEAIRQQQVEDLFKMQQNEAGAYSNHLAMGSGPNSTGGYGEPDELQNVLNDYQNIQQLTKQFKSQDLSYGRKQKKIKKKQYNSKSDIYMESSDLIHETEIVDANHHVASSNLTDGGRIDETNSQQLESIEKVYTGQGKADQRNNVYSQGHQNNSNNHPASHNDPFPRSDEPTPLINEMSPIIHNKDNIDVQKQPAGARSGASHTSGPARESQWGQYQVKENKYQVTVVKQSQPQSEKTSINKQASVITEDRNSKKKDNVFRETEKSQTQDQIINYEIEANPDQQRLDSGKSRKKSLSSTKKSRSRSKGENRKKATEQSQGFKKMKTMKPQMIDEIDKEGDSVKKINKNVSSKKYKSQAKEMVQSAADNDSQFNMFQNFDGDDETQKQKENENEQQEQRDEVLSKENDSLKKKKKKKRQNSSSRASLAKSRKSIRQKTDQQNSPNRKNEEEQDVIINIKSKNSREDTTSLKDETSAEKEKEKSDKETVDQIEEKEEGETENKEDGENEEIAREKEEEGDRPPSKEPEPLLTPIPIKDGPNIESIDIEDIRSSEHISEIDPPLSEIQPNLEPFSITAKSSSSTCLKELEMVDTDSSEEEQKNVKILEEIEFPQIRTVFKDLEANFLIECINSAQDLSRRFKFKFRKPCKSVRTLSHDILDFSTPTYDQYKQEQEIKNEMVREFAREEKAKIEESFKIGRNVTDPFEKIHTCSRIEIKDDKYCDRFMEQYRKVGKRSMVFIENFREHTRQWRMTYDPYQSLKILQTYGKNPPKSFKIRQKMLEQLKNILDRYSQITPVNDQVSVIDEIKQEFKNHRRDYYVQKNFLEHNKMEYLTRLLWSDLDQGQKFGITPLEFFKLEQTPLESLIQSYQKKLDQFDQDRNKYQEDVVLRLNQIKADLTDNDLINCTSFLERTYDQSDFEKRMFWSSQVTRIENYKVKRPPPMIVFWNIFHDFMVLHLSQRDMSVLSNEYAYIGPMQISHVNRQLRRALHQKWDLSLDKNREIVEYGYACYVVIYGEIVENMRQDFMEKEEYDAQFVLDPKIDHQVRSDYLQYGTSHLLIDNERLSVAYNDLFKSHQEQQLIKKRSFKSAKQAVYWVKNEEEVYNSYREGRYNNQNINIDRVRARITELIQIHQERVQYEHATEFSTIKPQPFHINMICHELRFKEDEDEDSDATFEKLASKKSSVISKQIKEPADDGADDGEPTYQSPNKKNIIDVKDTGGLLDSDDSSQDELVSEDEMNEFKIRQVNVLPDLRRQMVFKSMYTIPPDQSYALQRGNASDQPVTTAGPQVTAGQPFDPFAPIQQDADDFEHMRDTDGNKHFPQIDAAKVKHRYQVLVLKQEIADLKSVKQTPGEADSSDHPEEKPSSSGEDRGDSTPNSQGQEATRDQKKKIVMTWKQDQFDFWYDDIV